MQLRVVLVDPDAEDADGAEGAPLPEPAAAPADLPAAPPLAVRPVEDPQWVVRH